MIKDFTNDDLFAALSGKDVEEGCRCLLTANYSGGKDDKLSALKFAAELKRFRPDFLRRRAAEQNLPVVTQAAKHSAAQRLRSDLVKAWLIGSHRPLLESFLSTAGVPQEAGFVHGEPPAPTREDFRRAVDEVSAHFDQRVVAIYLGYQLINGGDFWENLRAAVTPDETTITQSGPSAQPSATVTEEVQPAGPEHSTEFTFLDDLLILRTVATAVGEIGALSEDQLEDVIEEVLSLNANRHRSVFHRGFFHALFERTPEFSFPGENTSRRIWYFTGLLMGLLRGSNKNRVVEIVRDQGELFALLCEEGSPVAANMLVPQLIPLLWDEGELTAARKLAESHFKGLDRKSVV